MSRLQATCERRLAGIPVPQPFDLYRFAEIVTDFRGRPVRILLVPGLSGTDGLTGCWLPRDEEDLILIDANASEWHRAMIGAHEIAHLLCDHQEGSLPVGELMANLLPDLGDTAIRKMLGRHGRYDAKQELEAEMTASLIVARGDADPISATSPGPPGIPGRLAHALRHPVRRDV